MVSKEADEDLGAFIHTTMFYTLQHPAPVYNCEDFTHQIEFMEKANKKRELIFFPETAWWLGFDNNLPLILPITGFSREYDIKEVISQFDFNGHVTYTTGREWTYWQYDHFLTRITWDSSLSWEQYLDLIKPMYGSLGETVSEVVKKWTALQKKHFYAENPLIYFYLAGELPQDEVGEQAGIVARRSKLAFKEVLTFSDEELAEWKTQNYDMLVSMLDEYKNLLHSFEGKTGVLPAMASDSALQQRLYQELYTSLYVYVNRIEHTIVLYRGVMAAREWEREKERASAAKPPEEPDKSIKEQAYNEAARMLAEAKKITSEMISIFRDMEQVYRYPIELLAREKLESPTSYKLGE